MANEFVQTMSDARVDARSLSDFVFKPAGFKVPRRLAPPIDTLQFYINRFNSLNGDFSSSVSVALSSLNNSVAEADGKVAYIETTVQDAINNTAVEGGVLAATFVTVEEQVTGEGALSLRSFNLKTIITVSDIATLLKVKPFNGRTVKVQGLQGGTFIYDNTKIAVNNGGTIFNGWVRENADGKLKVEWFGAKGDEITDDSDAINAALMSFTPDANGYRRGTVLLSNKSYLVSKPINLTGFQTLEGVGSGAQLYIAHTGKGIVTLPSAAIPLGSRFNRVRKMRIRTSKTIKPSHVFFNGFGANNLLEHLSIHDCWVTEHLVENDAGYGLMLSRCQIAYNRAEISHIALRQTNDEVKHSYAIAIHNCDLTGIYNSAGAKGTAILMDGGHLSLKDVVIQDGGTGIKSGNGIAYSPKVTLSNVYFEALSDYIIDARLGAGGTESTFEIQQMFINSSGGGIIDLGSSTVTISTLNTGGAVTWKGNGYATVAVTGTSVAAHYYKIKAINGVGITTPIKHVINPVVVNKPNELYGINLRQGDTRLVSITQWVNELKYVSEVFQISSNQNDYGSTTGYGFRAKSISRVEVGAVTNIELTLTAGEKGALLLASNSVGVLSVNVS